MKEPTRFSVVLIQEIVVVGDGGHVALHVNVAVFRVFVCYLTKIVVEYNEERTRRV